MPLPHQFGRIQEALKEGIEKRERESKKHAPFDGDGIIKEDVVCAASANTGIFHGLGRVPRGYIITRVRANATMDGWFRERERTSEYITLENGATTQATIDIWIF